jgi:Cys-tRNA(Pro)/Cys-tRNA(Cys) deacylase
MAEKTNAMRKLTSMKISFTEHPYDGAIAGTDVARVLGEDPAQVFKTLVTVGKTGAHYVFMVPVAEELDLKKAAQTVGEKSVEMIKAKELLPLTGYVHGGCSPIGMKKFFRTVVHRTAQDLPAIFFSGGKIGLQIELPPEKLAQAIKLEYADIIR